MQVNPCRWAQCIFEYCSGILHLHPAASGAWKRLADWPLEHPSHSKDGRIYPLLLCDARYCRCRRELCARPAWHNARRTAAASPCPGCMHPESAWLLQIGSYYGTPSGIRASLCEILPRCMRVKFKPSGALDSSTNLGSSLSILPFSLNWPRRVPSYFPPHSWSAHRAHPRQRTG
jgi:hypothetical protein